MARNNTFKFIKGTRANLDALAAASGLLAGEPYLITDENRIAVGLTPSTYSSMVKSADAATDAEARAMAATNKYLTPANLKARACFRAHKNGVAQTGIASATWTQVTFGTEAFDQGANYDTGFSRWTPPAGPVRLTSLVYALSGIVDDSYMQVEIYKNGTSIAGIVPIAKGTKDQTYLITTNDVANGSDYYEVWVNFSGAGAKSIAGTSKSTYFCGEQI